MVKEKFLENIKKSKNIIVRSQVGGMLFVECEKEKKRKDVLT